MDGKVVFSSGTSSYPNTEYTLVTSRNSALTSCTHSTTFAPRTVQPTGNHLAIGVTSDTHLVLGVTGVPQGVPHHLSRAGGRVDQLELNPWFGHSPERCRLPVRLRVLFPHDRVELLVALVTAEQEANSVRQFKVGQDLLNGCSGVR